MRASEIVKSRSRVVLTIGESETVRQAIHSMVANHIGSLVVLNGTNVVGIITERDILRESARDCERLATLKVAEVMTRDVITTAPEAEINEMLELMTEHRIRHLPVMVEGRLEGMVSIGDCVAAQLNEIKSENEQLKDYIQQPR